MNAYVTDFKSLYLSIRRLSYADVKNESLFLFDETTLGLMVFEGMIFKEWALRWLSQLKTNVKVG